MPVAERHRLDELFVDCLITKAAALGQMGRDREGSILVEGARRMAADHGFVGLEMRAMVNSVVQQIDQDPARALELGLEAVEQGRRYGVRPTLVFSVLNTAEIAVRLGEWSRADELIGSLLAIDLEPNDRIILLGTAATLALYRGDLDSPAVVEVRQLEHGRVEGFAELLIDDFGNLEAHLGRRFDEAFEIAMRVAAVDDLNGPAYYERAARSALWGGNLEGIRRAEAGLEALSRSAALPTAQLAGIRAARQALQGQRNDAIAAYRDLARRHREMRLVFDGALTRMDEARALGIDTAEGATAAADARSVLERLGARPFLALLDDLAAGGGARPSGRPAPTATETARA